MPKIVNQSTGTIALTPEGEKAIQHWPHLTWDEVLRRGDVLAAQKQAKGATRQEASTSTS